jgi:hypothetical protein
MGMIIMILIVYKYGNNYNAADDVGGEAKPLRPLEISMRKVTFSIPLGPTEGGPGSSQP